MVQTGGGRKRGGLDGRGLTMAGPDLSADVLVVGGGLAGCATAYFLAKEGADVLAIDRADLNAEASGCNAGSLHAQIPHEPFVLEGEEWARTFAPALRLMLASIELWGGLETELGADLEVAVTGGLLVAETEAQMRDVARKAAIERAFGLDVRLLGRDELRALAPYVSERMAGGAFCPTEGKASPLKATPAFARAARARGARFETGRRLVSIAREGSAFVAETDRGRIRAGRIVDAAGAGAGEVAAMVGRPLPIQGFPIQVNVTEPAAPLVPHLVYSAGEKLSLKQAKNGTLLIGGGWPARIGPDGRPRLDRESIVANLGVAMSVVPAVAGLKLVRTWPAIVNGTADWKPILGELPGVPGMFANVFPWMGFTAGPACARITADLVLGRDPGWDLSPFSAGRYV
jgi:sarcosine oxidase subunit beta